MRPPQNLSRQMSLSMTMQAIVHCGPISRASIAKQTGLSKQTVVSRIWWKFPICVLRVGSWLAVSGRQVKGFGGDWLR